MLVLLAGASAGAAAASMEQQQGRNNNNNKKKKKKKKKARINKLPFPIPKMQITIQETYDEEFLCLNFDFVMQNTKL